VGRQIGGSPGALYEAIVDGVAALITSDSA
jgi:hypothetical protein